LGLLKFIKEVCSCLLLEISIVLACKSVFVLVLDVLLDKVWCTESFVTDLADIFLAFDHFSGLLVAVLHLGLDQELILLRILDFIDKASFS